MTDLQSRIAKAVREIQSYAGSDVGTCRLALRILRENVPEAFA